MSKVETTSKVLLEFTTRINVGKQGARSTFLMRHFSKVIKFATLTKHKEFLILLFVGIDILEG